MPTTLTRSFILLFVAEFAFYVSGYIVQMGAGRILGPADYGKFTLVLTLTLLVANLIGNGIPIAMSKFLSEYAEKNPLLIPLIKRKGAWAQAFFMGSITLLFMLLSPKISQFLDDPSLTPLFFISAFIIPCFAADAFYFYYYSGTQQFNRQSILKLTRSLFRVILILGLTYAFQLQGIIAGYILVPLVVFGMALFMDRKQLFTTSPLTTANAFTFKTLIQLALPVTLFLVLFETLLSFDVYLIKYFYHDDHITGIYGAALTLARIPSYLFYALTLILLPKIAEYISLNNQEKITKTISQTLRFMLLSLIPLFILCFTFPKALILFFFGAKFIEASNLMPLLVVGTSLLSFIYIFSFAYKGANRIHIPIFFTLTAILLNLLFDSWFLPTLHIAGIPYAKIITPLLLLPFFIWSLKKTFGFTIWNSVWKALLAGLIMLLPTLLLKDSLFVMFIASPLLLVLYGACLFLFKEFPQEVLNHLNPKLLFSSKN